MTSFAVDRKRGWNTVPWGRLRFFLNIPRTDLQIADLIKLNGLKTRIGNRQRIAGYSIAGSEIVFGVSAFPTPTRNSRASNPILPRTLSA